ncbi:MAG: DUF4395 domain-containing protein [Microbacterium sp.]|jgi:hypothetical protein|nr:DUF4395 domain-containing protein [Microbacterium sp.]
MSDSSPIPRPIDPRGPRFAAGITAVLLAAAVVLSLLGISTQRGSAGWYAFQPAAGATFSPDVWTIQQVPVLTRLLDPAALLLILIAALFLWGVLSPATAPWGLLFRKAVAPRLTPPTDLEDPRPPRFAQGVGLFVVTVGIVLHLAGVPWALPIAAAAAFAAAFLNAVFGVCLGCMLYLALARVRQPRVA